MPTSTYVALATTTLASASSSVTFSSIPATYRDLVVVASVSSTGGADGFVRFNGDTGSNYSSVRMYGTGSAAGSDSYSTVYGHIGDVWGTQGNILLQIMDYSATDKHKTYLSRANAPANTLFGIAGRWASTTAVTSVQLFLASQSFVAGSTFSLFGIEA